MLFVYGLVAGLLVGGGLAYGFRGYLIRKRLAIAASLKQSAEDVLKHL